MTLSERNRRILFEQLSDVVGDQEAVGEMLSNFPDDDDDRPATRRDLDDLRAELHTDAAGFRSEIRSDFERLETRFDGLETRFDGLETRFGEVDSRLDGVDSRLIDLRTDMLVGFADLRTEAADRETRMMGFVHAEVQTATRWTIGFLVSSQAVLVAALAAFG